MELYQRAIDTFNKHVDPDITQQGTIGTAANQAASTATDVAGVVTDLNALLTKLKAAGLMTADT